MFKLNGLVFGRRYDRKNNHCNMQMDFLLTPQVKKAAVAAKAKARAEFQKRFPNADIRQFTIEEVIFDEKHNATGEVELKAGLGLLQDPEGIDGNNWRRALSVALGFGSFPYQLMLTKNIKKNSESS